MRDVTKSTFSTVLSLTVAYNVVHGADVQNILLILFLMSAPAFTGTRAAIDPIVEVHQQTRLIYKRYLFIDSAAGCVGSPALIYGLNTQ